jgi:hypothetical protein
MENTNKISRTTIWLASSWLFFSSQAAFSQSDLSDPNMSQAKRDYLMVHVRAQQAQDQRMLMSAQQAENRGDWHQAEFAYRSAASSDVADINQQNALNLRWAYCQCREITETLNGKPSHVRMDHCVSEMHDAYEALKRSDKGNADWNYLCAVYWACNIHTKDWNYIKAWNQLVDALNCARITPSIKEKCLALKEHIAGVKQLQVMDMARAVFEMKQDLVWNVEHPHRVGSYFHRNYTGDLVSITPIMNTDYWSVESYDVCKRDLAGYPKFKVEWQAYLEHMHAIPNNAITPPPGPGNEAPAMYCPPQWEKQAFGPLDLSAFKQYPHRGDIGHLELHDY